MDLRSNMKSIFAICAISMLLSCAPRTGYITEAQLQDTAFVTGAPFDTLTAYRKAPGGEKTVQVSGYYRKDSTYVPAHARTERRTNAEMLTQ